MFCLKRNSTSPFVSGEAVAAATNPAQRPRRHSTGESALQKILFKTTGRSSCLDSPIVALLVRWPAEISFSAESSSQLSACFLFAFQSIALCENTCAHKASFLAAGRHELARQRRPRFGTSAGDMAAVQNICTRLKQAEWSMPRATC